jgi:glycosyltransferase involved in cell wall biosynthesis
MNIVQITTSDVYGGAARASHRLFKGLFQSGVNTSVLTLNKDSSLDNIYRIISSESQEQAARRFLLDIIKTIYINRNRTEISNTIFSLPYPGYDLSAMQIIRDADIINLHWITHFQSPVTLKKLFSLGKPVVWTLHDQWAFTGGCHYSAGCDKYKAICSGCPQLNDDPFDLTTAVLRDKLELFSGANLTIVSPSRWLANIARESSLFKNLRIETIANALETDLFVPIPTSEAKQKLDIESDVVTILFGTENGNEKRKGFTELLRSIEVCFNKPEFRELIKSKKLSILCFGNPNEKLDSLGIPVVSSGYIKSDETLRNIYCAADICVISSLEENLPNIMLESMSCGTPVIAFDIGGMPDVIHDGENGRLVPSSDFRSMGKALLDLIFNYKERKAIGENCRRTIEDGFSLDVQAKRYLKLFNELITNDKLGYHPDFNRTATEKINVKRSSEIDVNTDPSLGPNFQQIYERCLQFSINVLTKDLTKTVEELHHIKSNHDELINGRIWRATSPLRKIKKLIYR